MGEGKIKRLNSAIRMEFLHARRGRYTDVQIDDYMMGPMGSIFTLPLQSRFRFSWRPPLRMKVRARFSHKAATEQTRLSAKNVLRGTAGFGFWNNPFSLSGDLLTLPEAIWFFYAAPPADIQLVPGVHGWGWKAQVVHAKRWGSVASVFPMLGTMAYGKISRRYQLAERWMQRLAGAGEHHVTGDMRKWHTYVIDWMPHSVKFTVDNKPIFGTNLVPSGRLGFVVWIDNQYAVATPQGDYYFGTVDTGHQWMDIGEVHIEYI